MKRREFVGLAGAAVGAGLIAARPVAAAARVPTPSQAEGPFYPVEPIPLRSDLVRRVPDRIADGTLLELSGQVLDLDGRPLAGARVEIWQCDNTGHYRHPRDSAPERLDPGFDGYGAQLTDRQGAYRFLTIMPVPYTGRPPHIHAKVHHPGGVLITQIYLKGQEAERGFLSLLMGGDRSRLVIDPQPAGKGRAARFSFVV
ncbi:MAG: intradiol ring-cleavage dioxygenase [Burkholderiales bacterium]|nr:MAG: intradiol ring-cleavage dioxygenase [Burkholderiales bacterium]